MQRLTHAGERRRTGRRQEGRALENSKHAIVGDRLGLLGFQDEDAECDSCATWTW